MKPIGVTVRESGDTIQPTVRMWTQLGEHTVSFDVTARGYQNLTGRKHPRVKAMRTAYRRRQR